MVGGDGGDLSASFEARMLPALLPGCSELATSFRARSRREAECHGLWQEGVTSVIKPDCPSSWEEASGPDSVCQQIGFFTLCCTPSPHQVVCGSKYLVRGESALDHVDLLVSSRHWPPVYVVDMATPVALCADLCYPELTNQMWGRNQGCFSSPTEPPVVSSLLRNWDACPWFVGKTFCEPSTTFFLHQCFVSVLWNQHLLHKFLLTHPMRVCEATACHLGCPG